MTRAEEEVSWLHDLLIGMLGPEVRGSMSKEERYYVAGMIDALCWVMRHDANESVESLINDALAWLAANRMTFAARPPAEGPAGPPCPFREKE